MDLDTAMTMVLNFMAAGPENEKVAFIKSLLGTQNCHQFKVTKNLVVKQKRRKANELKSIPKEISEGAGWVFSVKTYEAIRSVKT
ncbi:unnamed protein product [Allacma fusca]|uniref:Uncharacterized protein n=1 Tax=Allacma fusca TaxID=39272 RepID=A0A8J2L903_9HEXA|nr:unnamed protein product [Allacma fusca]